MSIGARALTREARKAETRRALIEAASDLFAAQGIEATSLDEVAARVGLTKGAVYAHFTSKTQLVEEVLQAASVVVDPEELLDPSLSLEERFAHLGREAAELVPGIARRSVMLHLEYFLYELRDPSRRRRAVRERRDAHARAGVDLEIAERERGERLLVPGAELAALLQVIGNGLVLEFALDDKAISRKTIEIFFAALGRGLETVSAR